MISKELKKLSRRELVDIIYQMKKNEQQLQEEVASLQEALQDRRIRIEEAGSVADAALSITDVLSAAQKTADVYLYEISCMKAEAEETCSRMLEEARGAVDKIFEDGRKQCEELSSLYSETYTKYQQLQEEIQVLEDKKRGLYEDLEYGKEV